VCRTSIQFFPCFSKLNSTSKRWLGGLEHIISQSGRVQPKLYGPCGKLNESLARCNNVQRESLLSAKACGLPLFPEVGTCYTSNWDSCHICLSVRMAFTLSGLLLAEFGFTARAASPIHLIYHQVTRGTRDLTLEGRCYHCACVVRKLLFYFSSYVFRKEVLATARQVPNDCPWHSARGKMAVPVCRKSFSCSI
jgi:hypothetical protein